MLADGGGVEEDSTYVSEEEEASEEYCSEEELLGFESDEGDDAGVGQVKRQSMYVPRRGSRRKSQRKSIKPVAKSSSTGKQKKDGTDKVEEGAEVDIAERGRSGSSKDIGKEGPVKSKIDSKSGLDEGKETGMQSAGEEGIARSEGSNQGRGDDQETEAGGMKRDSGGSAKSRQSSSSGSVKSGHSGSNGSDKSKGNCDDGRVQSARLKGSDEVLQRVRTPPEKVIKDDSASNATEIKGEKHRDRTKSILKKRKDSVPLPRAPTPKRFSVGKHLAIEVYTLSRDDPLRKSFAVEEMGKERQKSPLEEKRIQPDRAEGSPTEDSIADDFSDLSESDMDSLEEFLGLRRMRDHDLEPDANARRVRVLPLHWFDDTSFDDRLPEEWLTIAVENGIQHPVPVMALLPKDKQPRRLSLVEDPLSKTKTARHIIFTMSTGPQVWTPAAVIGYHPVRGLYMLRRVDVQEYFLLPRIYVMFCAEDPARFCERVQAAVRLRQVMQDLMRYHLYVDCMPTSILKQLDIDQVGDGDGWYVAQMATYAEIYLDLTCCRYYKCGIQTTLYS